MAERAPLTLEQALANVQPPKFTDAEWAKLNRASAAYHDRRAPDLHGDGLERWPGIAVRYAPILRD